MNPHTDAADQLNQSHKNITGKPVTGWPRWTGLVLARNRINIPLGLGLILLAWPILEAYKGSDLSIIPPHIRKFASPDYEYEFRGHVYKYSLGGFLDRLLLGFAIFCVVWGVISIFWSLFEKGPPRL